MVGAQLVEASIKVLIWNANDVRTQVCMDQMLPGGHRSSSFYILDVGLFSAFRAILASHFPTTVCPLGALYWLFL